jgi:hypothetical protein
MSPEPVSGDIARSILYFWLAASYVGFIAWGALPSDKSPGRRKQRQVLIDRGAFFLMYFAIPLLGFTLAGLKVPGMATLSIGRLYAWLLPVTAIGAAAFCIGFFSRKGAAEIANYPQYLPPVWTWKTIVIEIFSWSLYLFAYEFAFRGMILHGLLPSGYWTAIAVQTGLYAFAHLPKSGREAAGAIVFGLATSLMTLAWGTLLPAFFCHLALALGNDLGCERARKSALA